MSPERKRPRIFYGWFLVGACSTIIFYMAGVAIYGFTAFFEPIAKDFPNWSYAQISFASSLRGFEAGLLAPIMGFLVDRYGPRKLIFAGGIIHWIIGSLRKKWNTPREQADISDRDGLLFASGLITGEALMGILLAIPIVILKQFFEINLPIIKHITGKTMPFGGLIGTVLLIGIALLLLKTTIRKAE